MKIIMHTFNVILFLTFHYAVAIDKEKFYPFGNDNGDLSLEVGDDVHSDEIVLQTPINLYDASYSTLFVNSNGFVSFESPLAEYKADAIIPIGHAIISPFLADVDTHLSGNIFYRETQEPSLLDAATSLIKKSFSAESRFQANSLFIVTWDDVGYYDGKNDKVNSFQLVIASDGSDSFAIYLYADDGINWVRGDGKFFPVEDVFAQVGVEAADGQRYFTFPESGTQNVARLQRTSNVGLPGVWSLKIGNLNDGQVAVPKVSNAGEPKTCALGGNNQCHEKAVCKDYSSGFCCECLETFVGNGQQCIEPNAPQRISGKVSGVINEFELENVDLHGYAVTSDGRAYTSVSRIPQPVGIHMQTLFSLGSILNWLYALPATSDVKNGFMITGGKFNRTANIQFQPGGERVIVTQKFEDFDESGNMLLASTINGQIPSFLSLQSRLTIPEFKETFRRVKKGTIKSAASHTYLVDGESFTFTVDQTINYKECDAKALNDLQPQVLTATRTYASYGENEELVRFASLNRLSIADEDDPCKAGVSQCAETALCLVEGTTFRCVCKDGYEGDGQTCNDIDECSLNIHDCHQNAHCVNSDGTYECSCMEGYIGDGKRCSGAQGCDTLNNCSPNAECTIDDTTGQYQCKCQEGFTGNGIDCSQDETEEGTGDDDDAICRRCDVNSKCVYDSTLLAMKCKCNQGYSGSGFQCDREGELCDLNCDRNADCLFDSRKKIYNCVCKQGYSGNGYECQDDRQGCNVVGGCDSHADCSYDQSANRYTCLCQKGWVGDGKTCQPKPSGTAGSYLLFSQGKVIYEVPFKSSEENPGKRIITAQDQVIIGLDVDCNMRQVYWTDIAAKQLYRADLDGSNQENVVENLISPEDIAVDWLSRNVYWTDSGLDNIEVSRFDGSSRKILISTDLENPRAVQADPIRGYLFWTDWNRKAPKIERSYLDGSNRLVIVKENLGLPNGLVIDFAAQRLCWADAGSKNIECISYDGRNRRIIFAKATYPFDITYAQNVFFWTDWETKSVSSVNEFAETINEPLILPPGSNGKLYGLTVVPDQCPRGTNACKINNGGCRYLCLPTPNGGRTCACPSDISDEECSKISHL